VCGVACTEVTRLLCTTCLERGHWYWSESCNPNAFQMRWTVGRLMPVAAAIDRTLQWVASRGVDSNIFDDEGFDLIVGDLALDIQPTPPIQR
jgi:hypothetical protein